MDNTLSGKFWFAVSCVYVLLDVCSCIPRSSRRGPHCDERIHSACPSVSHWCGWGVYWYSVLCAAHKYFFFA